MLWCNAKKACFWWFHLYTYLDVVYIFHDLVFMVARALLGLPRRGYDSGSCPVFLFGWCCPFFSHVGCCGRNDCLASFLFILLRLVFYACCFSGLYVMFCVLPDFSECVVFFPQFCRRCGGFIKPVHSILLPVCFAIFPCGAYLDVGVVWMWVCFKLRWCFFFTFLSFMFFQQLRCTHPCLLYMWDFYAGVSLDSAVS